MHSIARMIWLCLAAVLLAASAGAHSGHWRGHHHGHRHCHGYGGRWHHCDEGGLDHLRSIQPAQKITIVAEPETALILVDGEPLEGAAHGASISLLEGVHQLQVRAPGYHPVDREIWVEGASGRRIEIHLDPKR